MLMLFSRKCIFLFSVAVFLGCSRQKVEMSSSRVATAAELKSLGVVVLEKFEGKQGAVVGGGPVQLVKEIIFPILQTNNIIYSGDFHHGLGTIYVEVGDFYKARDLILKEKRRQHLDDLKLSL